jgi:hypothetical protein
MPAFASESDGPGNHPGPVFISEAGARRPTAASHASVNSTEMLPNTTLGHQSR